MRRNRPALSSNDALHRQDARRRGDAPTLMCSPLFKLGVKPVIRKRILSLIGIHKHMKASIIADEIANEIALALFEVDREAWHLEEFNDNEPIVGPGIKRLAFGTQAQTRANVWAVVSTDYERQRICVQNAPNEIKVPKGGNLGEMKALIGFDSTQSQTALVTSVGPNKMLTTNLDFPSLFHKLAEDQGIKSRLKNIFMRKQHIQQIFQEFNLDVDQILLWAIEGMQQSVVQVDYLKKNQKGRDEIVLPVNRQIEELSFDGTVYESGSRVMAIPELPDHHFMVITEGEVEIHKGKSRGNRQCIGTLGKGEIIGERVGYGIKKWPNNLMIVLKPGAKVSVVDGRRYDRLNLAQTLVRANMRKTMMANKADAAKRKKKDRPTIDFSFLTPFQKKNNVGGLFL